MKKKKLRLALILIIVTVIAAALIIFAIKKSENCKFLQKLYYFLQS